MEALENTFGSCRLKFLELGRLFGIVLPIIYSKHGQSAAFGIVLPIIYSKHGQSAAFELVFAALGPFAI